MAWLALVPLAVAVASRSDSRTRPRADDTGPAWLPSGSLAIGLSFGLSHQLLLLAWVPGTVALTHTYLALPFYAVLAVSLACLEAIAVVAMVGAHRRIRVPLPVAVAVPWVALEWTRAHLGGLSFPWGGLALGLTGFPAVLGVAEWVGERGVALWLAGTAGWVASGLRRDLPRAGRARLLGGAALVAVVPSLAGSWRTAHLPVQDVARVAILQPNLSTRLRQDPDVAVDSALVRFRRLSARLPAAADLWLAPEVALPRVLDEDSVLVTALASMAGRTPWVLGAFSSDSAQRRYNAAWVLEEGLLQPHPWEKTRLVPGWERTPGFGGGVLDPDGMHRGRRRTGIRAAGVEWGVLICFESLFGELARDQVNGGAQALLSLTNDAWFDEAGALGRAAAEQHLAHLVLRAIETRKGVARAANTGISAIIEPSGVIRERMDSGTEGAAWGPVRAMPGRTAYVRTGDWVGALSALMVFLGVIYVRTRPPREAT